MSHSEPQLDPRDSHVVDRFVRAGWSRDQMGDLNADDARAAEALERIGTLIDLYPAASADPALVDATVLAIEHHDAERAKRMSVVDAPISRTRFRRPDFIGVAASLLLLVAVAVPIADRVRASGSQSVCANGFRELGSAFAAYSNDSNGALPMAASIGSILSSSGGRGALPAPAVTQNAQAIQVLAHNGYCKPGCLHCAGARAISYRVPLHARHLRMTTIHLSPLAADANPLYANPTGSAEVASMNHGGAGQNILFTDGAVLWKALPVMAVGPNHRPDNIWTPRGVSGREAFDLRDVTFDSYEVFLGQ